MPLSEDSVPHSEECSCHLARRVMREGQRNLGGDINGKNKKEKKVSSKSSGSDNNPCISTQLEWHHLL